MPLKTSTPDLIPIPLMREILREHSSHGAPLLPSLLAALTWGVFSFAGVVFTRLHKLDFAVPVIVSLVGLGAAMGVYSLSRWLLGNDPRSRFCKVIFKKYRPLLRKMRVAGFAAAATMVEDIVRETIGFIQEKPNLFAVIDEAQRFYLSKFVSIMVVTEVPKDYELTLRDLRGVEKRLVERPAETQVGNVSAQADLTIRAELAHIQIRLNRLERAIQAGLHLTNEIGEIRGLCKRLRDEVLYGDGEMNRAEALVTHFNEKGPHLEAELSRLGF